MDESESVSYFEIFQGKLILGREPDLTRINLLGPPRVCFVRPLEKNGRDEWGREKGERKWGK